MLNNTKYGKLIKYHCKCQKLIISTAHLQTQQNEKNINNFIFLGTNSISVPLRVGQNKQSAETNTRLVI